MRSILFILIALLFFHEIPHAGTLTGRIIKENGNSLANIEIVIEGKKVKTNVFGAYKVDIEDGKHELTVEIFTEEYSKVTFKSDEVTIYSPTTKQNWRVDKKSKRWVKIK